MFSRWVSRVTTSLSPKAWLAKHVAQTLNEVFVLTTDNDNNNGNGNNGNIESNLLTDTKIVLKNARLRPRQLSPTAWLLGEVEEMEFSWIWGGSTGGGGSSSSSFVRDTRLTIRGAKFRIVVGNQPLTPEELAEAIPLVASAPTQNSAESSANNSTASSAAGYMQRQIQQIVDSLTLDVTDFSLLIIEGEESEGRIHVQAKSLQLISFGRQQEGPSTTGEGGGESPAPPLSQRISLESIGIKILQGYTGTDMPLLDPIGYAASVKRVAGRRFLDGGRTGLEVVGEILNGEGFVIHAGSAQMQTISRLLKPLMAVDADNGSTVTSKHEEPSPSERIAALSSTGNEVDNEDFVFLDSNETLPIVVDNGQCPAATSITMPLPSVMVILPGGTTICMPNCTFLYNMDGSMTQLLGNQGISIGGQPFLQFATDHTEAGVGVAPDVARWKMDFVQHMLSLEKPSVSTAAAAHLEWNDAIMKQVVTECQQLMSAVPQQLVEQVEAAIHEHEETASPKPVSEPSPESTTTWRFESGSGSILSMRVTGDQDWVQASLGSPSVAISTDSTGKFKLAHFGLDKVQIGPTSFGTSKSSMIQIPRLALTTDGNAGQQCIVFQDCIDATLESQAVMSQLQDFGLHLIDFPSAQPDVAASISSLGKTVSDASGKMVDVSQMPSLRIPGVRLRLEDESMQAMIEDVAINDPSADAVAISCGMLQGWIRDSNAEKMPLMECVSAQGITAQLRQGSKKLTINQINKLCVPGFVERLVEPLQTIRLRYDATQAKLQVDVSSHLHLEVTPTLTGTGTTEATPTTSSAGLYLPISVQARLAKVTLSSARKSVGIQPLQIAVAPDGMGVTASLWGNATAIRVQVKDEEEKECRWLDASIAAGSAVTLSNALEVMELECAGARVGGTSCGHLDISIPPFSLSKVEGVPLLKATGLFAVSLQSIAVTKEVQSMMESLMGSLATTQDDPLSAAEPLGLPTLWQQIEVILPNATVIIREPSHVKIQAANLRIRFNDAQADTIAMSTADNVASFGKLSLLVTGAEVALSPDYQPAALSLNTVSLKGDNGLAMSFSGATANLEAPETALVCLGRIDTLVVPQTFELLEPMTDTSFSFADGCLVINAAKICGVCPQMTSQKQSGNSNNPNLGAGNTSPTFPIHAKVQELSIKASKESAVAISITPIDLLVVPSEGVVSVDTNCKVYVRILDSAKNRWLQATIAPVSMVIDPLGPSSLLKQASCSIINIGPSSSGRVGITIPSVELSHSSAIQSGEVTGAIESFDIVQQLQSLFQECFPSDGSGAPMPFTLCIPRIIILVFASKAKFVVESLSSNGAMDELKCSRFGCQDESGMAAAFSGLHAKIGNSYSAEIATIDALYIPGMCSIERPLQQKTTLAFDSNDGLSIGVPPIDVIVFGGSEENTPDQSPAQDGTGIEIPFPVRLNLQQVNIRSFSKDGERTRLSQLAFHLRPQDMDPFAEGVPQAVMFHLVVTSAENKLLKLATSTVSGVVYPSDLSTIHRLKLSTAAAEVAVGFSSVDWASIFGNQTNKEISKPISLPLCSVEKFVAHLKYNGVVLGVQKTAVNVPALQGGHNTDSTELANHLKNAMLDRVPAIITNASIFGENVSELAAKNAGRAFLAASTATGCAAGSVIGLVACDSVRGSIAAGKKSRGVEASEGYKFGDITRGAVHSIKQAASAGGQSRRGASDSYQFGDLTVGAAQSVGSYTSQNASRLGSAGVSGMGMVIGCALAGPVGLVAGSLIGSRLGSVAFTDKDPKVTTSPAPESPQQPDGTADLLGFGGTPVQGNSLQPQRPTATENRHTRSLPPTPMQPPQYRDPRRQRSSRAQPHANVQHNPQNQYARHQHQPQHERPQQPAQQQQQDQGYRFGDLTRKVVAKGKEKSGRSDSDGYKFGDLTRGLFG